MLSASGIVVIGLSILISLMGFTVLIRNFKYSRNRWFFAMSILMAIWLPANYIDSNFQDYTIANLALKIDLSVALLMVWSFSAFVGTFITGQGLSLVIKKLSNIMLYGGLLVNIVLVAAILFNKMARIGIVDGAQQIIYSPLFLAYTFFLMCYLLYISGALFIVRQTTDSAIKKAINTVFIGYLVAIATNTLANMVAPIIFNSRHVLDNVNLLGYIGFLILIISIYFSIARQKLFDIKLLIARTIVYGLSLFILAASFGFIVFGLAILFFNQHFSPAFIAYGASATTIVALSFSTVKRFFDRVTNKLFFQDAYDTQELIASLNRVLIASNVVNTLIDKAVEIIDKNLNSEFTVVNLQQTKKENSRFIGDSISNIDTIDMNEIIEEVNKNESRVLVADRISEDSVSLYRLMRKHNIAVIAKLHTVQSNTGSIGYILVGDKKSGNPYSSKDTGVIEVISGELVIAIQNALQFEEIQKFNETLQAKVDDATRKLQRTNDKLKQLDETKDEFISMASHQLRTPLTSVKGYLSMVLEGDVGTLNDMQRKLLMQSFNSSQRMVYLISDLLNLSRLRTGKFIIEPKVTNLADVIEGEVEQLSANAKGRGLTLNYNKPKNFPDLYMDETKIRQVIMNFADNAIYYTPSGGKIDINLVNNKDTIEFTVVDNGIGVPLADQKHMFTKFYRAKNAQKARPDGTGLGIFMAKKVIIAQGGALIFESKPDKGSTFGFSISKSGLKVPS